MKIGIIGGGITGLTTALALHKLGIEAVVYEQAGKFSEVGAGIWLQPNAIKVLDWLGVKDRIRQQGIELNRMEITDTKLVALKKMRDDVVQDEAGNRTVAIHRARLQKILFDEVSKIAVVKFNKTYVGHTLDSGAINVKFEDGEEVPVDLLLGADGINSKVRRILFPHSSVRSARQVCWRGISKMKLPDLLNQLGREAWGDQVRFGFSSIHDREVYWFAVANEIHLGRVKETSTKKYITELLRNFSPIVAELVANTDKSSIHQTILYDLNRLAKWHAGNVCLIGDAAHATTPNMGQGAGQGIEDAYHISRLLAKTGKDEENVFRQFELMRRKKVDYVVNNSWKFGKLAHSRIGQPLLKLLLRITPERVMNSQMNKLYSIDSN